MEDIWSKVRTPIGIDIGTAAVKVAQGDKGRLLFGACETPAGTVDGGRVVDRPAVGRALRTALHRAGTKGKMVVLGVGGFNVTARSLTLPPMSTEETREAARWEIAGSLNYDPAHAIIDFLDLGGNADKPLDEAWGEVATATAAANTAGATVGQQAVLGEPSEAVVGEAKNILAVAVEEGVVTSLVETALDVGLEPVAVDILPAALGRILRFLEGGASRNAAMIDIGASVTEISFFRRGKLSVVRPVAIGAASLAADDSREQLAAEIRRSVNFFRAQSRWEEVDVAFLVGGGVAVPGLSTYLGQETGLDVRPANEQLKVTRLCPPEVLGAVGLALWEAVDEA